MPIETDLSVSPYFDEGAAGLEKNYYKVLFKPSVPVQVRELNELQTILQNQIEEFGDNILKRGTIIRGCSFSFYNNYPYIKIKDSQVDGAPVNESSMIGKIVTGTNNLQAKVINYAEGFESTDPDTKTLYLRYINSGDSGNVTTFAASQVLKVQDSDLGVTNVVINSAGAGTGYANSDAVVFVSAVALTEVTGTIVVGSTMTQPTTGANAYVLSVDTSTYPNKTILYIRPLTSDLADSTKSANAWTFSTGDDSAIKSLTNAAVTAVVTEIIGTGASAVATTDAAQRVVDVSMTSFGTGYYVAPHVTVRSTTGGTGVSLTALNYSSRITVYSGANSVGMGYAFGVSDGVIYQKGYFLKVPAQTVVVSKYTTTPNNLSVGFSTSENIVDSYEDTALLDNALGTRNYTAPGADRLQLEPELFVSNTDVAKSNLEFFSIVEFSDGVPYKQNQRTVYNGINDELALRTRESAGDYVTDQFLVACKTTRDPSLRANTFTVVVDPGTAYIDGYRVQTHGNYQFTLDKGIDTETRVGANVSLNYGSYVTVNELAGVFDFSAAGTVALYDSPKNYLSTSGNYSGGTISANGTQIGSAKVRSVVYADTAATSYPQGSPDSRYNVYLFDIQMNPGRSFTEVESVYYNGATHDGIADVVLEDITTAGAGSGSTVYGAVLKNTVGTDKKTLDKLIFYTGFDSPLAINTVSYQYKKFSTTAYSIVNSGSISITLTGSDYFPFGEQVSDEQKRNLVFTPLQDTVANTNAGGSSQISISASSNSVSSANASFTTSLRVGDYIRLGSNSTGGTELRRITKISNGTHLQIDSNGPFTNATGTATRTFPAYVPLPILTREGIIANGTNDYRTLNIDLGTGLLGTSLPMAASFNISVANSSVAQKTPNRNLYVKIYPANNSTGFEYSDYGTAVSGTFTSGSNAVSSTTTSSFSASQRVKITVSGQKFDATVGTITNSTHMTLSSAVNFNGTGTIAAAVNLNGPWCLGVADIFRLRNVYIANTVNVNTNSFNVTRDFYIDHNHNPNFADLGFLVKEKKSSLVIGPSDYLLVQFDAFTYSDGLPIAINSYVSSNTITRANTDAQALSNLTNTPLSVNTLEIPEIVSPTGTYYDMIGYFDFRPKVANTANLATTTAGATVNPAYTVSFTAAEKKFPVPDSSLTFTTEFFKGRIDTLYVGSDGRIGTAKGNPFPASILNTREPEDLLTPIKNKNTMILNYVKVPAYPSIEENTSSVVNEIINKRVINERFLSDRLQNKAITEILTARDVAREQPRGYSMEDIGSLERRIRDLEYYVSLTLLELSVKDLKLPSSVSPNINRFKYGFFVDAFDDLTYTASESVEYAAAIENNRVVPSYETFKIVTPAPPCEYTDFEILSQTKATGDDKEPPPPDKPTVCVNTAAAFDTSTDKPTQKWFITMASDLANTSGQVRLFAYFYGGSLNSGPLRVFQSKVAGQFPADGDFKKALFTAINTSGITGAEKEYLRSIPGSTFQKGDSFKKKGTNHGKDGPKGGGEYFLRRGGKLFWNHNPANGNYYKIVTSEAGKLRVEYPANIPCPNPNPLPGGGGGAPVFNGRIQILDGDDTVTAKFDSNPKDKLKDNVTASYYRIHLKVTGLKATTLHKLYFNKLDMSHLCDTSVQQTTIPTPPVFSTTSNQNWETYNTQVPDFFNDSPNGFIMSDASGQIELYLYVLQDEIVTYKKNGKKKTTKSDQDEVKNPTIEIYNSDKSSYAYVVTTQVYKLFSGFK